MLIFSSCVDDKTKNHEKTVLNDTHDSLRTTIMGSWGDREGNLGWKITKDSMYYYNEKKSYYYFIHDKDMRVLYKDGPFMLGSINVLKDTLFFTPNNSGIIKAFRVPQ